jgi:lysophospholipase L1-like esterase
MLTSLCALLLCASIFMPAAFAQEAEGAVSAPSGPTPYPKDDGDWPGTGVVRVFDWMSDNRRHFWEERDHKQGSIVFAGDSLTGNWRTLADEFPPANVANRGIGGDVSRGLLFRFEEDVLALHPKAIVILIGTNDLTARQSADETLANIRGMLWLRRSQQPDTPVILCTVPPSENPKAPVDARQRHALNEGLRRITASDPSVSFVDLFTAVATVKGTPDERYFKEDRLHLSEAGYARWKAVLIPALRKVGALPES